LQKTSLMLGLKSNQFFLYERSQKTRLNPEDFFCGLPFVFLSLKRDHLKKFFSKKYKKMGVTGVDLN
jgi:hypothetical protein